MNKLIINAKEASKILGINYWKLLELVKAKKIPHIKVGNRILFREETLEKWLAQKEKQSVERDYKQKITGIKKLGFDFNKDKYNNNFLK